MGRLAHRLVRYLRYFGSVHFLRDKMQDFRLKSFDSKLRALTGAERRSVGHRANFMLKPRQGLVPATSGAPSQFVALFRPSAQTQQDDFN